MPYVVLINIKYTGFKYIGRVGSEQRLMLDI